MLVLAAIVGMYQGLDAADAEVDFETQVAPILQRHCIRCHSPGNKEGDISLSTVDDLSDNEYVVRGDPESSHFIELITATDGKAPEMPKESDPLSEDQVDLLGRWISEGAAWPADAVVKEKSKADSSWWSLQPLRSQESRTIDDFVSEKLAEHDLSLSPQADRRTLIRRATYDLTRAAADAGRSRSVRRAIPIRMAYEKLIDRLLASPHYGERWGRHWLDVVRFGESIGYERNVIINDLWPFRDYVIKSINDDKPFDQLIREHLAGDVFGKDDPDVAWARRFWSPDPMTMSATKTPRRRPRFEPTRWTK